jgi:hypothetical protein
LAALEVELRDNSIRSMKTIVTIALAVMMSQSPGDTPEAHVARAKVAAANNFQSLFNFLCTGPARSTRRTALFSP